jgi:hypothetical protein
MTIRRLKLFSAVILTMLAMLVSPVAACVCSHHDHADKVAASCHEHSVKPGVEHETAAHSAESTDECACVTPAPKVLGKADGVELHQHQAAGSSLPAIDFPVTQRAIFLPSFEIEAVKIHDSFNTSPPSRGPPASS